MDKEFINKNAEMILDFTEEFGKYYIKKFGFRDLEEVKDRVYEILTTKCGDLAYNLEFNKKSMKSAFYKKCEKCLIIYRNMKFVELMTEKLTDFNTEYNSEKKFKAKNKRKEKLDLDDWNIEEEENMMLHMLSNLLEEGYGRIEAFENVAEKLNIDIDTFLKKIEIIREKNIEKAEGRIRGIVGDER